MDPSNSPPYTVATDYHRRGADHWAMYTRRHLYMENNTTENLSESVAINQHLESRVHTTELSYTWTIEQFIARTKHFHCYSVPSIESPIINLCNNDDQYEFQLKILPGDFWDCDEHSESRDINIRIETLLCPVDDKTQACVGLSIILIDGDEYKPKERICCISKDRILLYAIRASKLTDDCLSYGSLKVKLNITFYNDGSCDHEIDNADLLDEAIALPLRTSILDEYEELFNSAKFSDLTIVVGNKKFSAHKAILASRSPFFSDMFEHKMLEGNRGNIIEITDVEPEIMDQVLRFIYTGKVKNVEIFGSDLLNVAVRYQLEALKIMCIGAILKDLNTGNFADILKIVDRYNTCRVLRDFVMKFLIENRKELTSSKNFKQKLMGLSPSLLTEVIMTTMKS